MLWIWVRDTNPHLADVLTHLVKSIACAFPPETGARLVGFTQPACPMPAQASCPANPPGMLHLPVDSGVLRKQ